MYPNSHRDHKVLITGTGRAGTTMLVHLLTDLGLDTGITPKNWKRKFYPHCNAGLEHDLLDPETPYIVKNPALCDTLPTALATGRFTIDHVYIPIRKLETATASRLRHGGAFASVPGGIVGTADPAQQRAVLAENFHKLIHVLVTHEIPHTFIQFPRLVSDPGYLYGKLSFLMKEISRPQFDTVFHRIADQSMVHDFREASPQAAPPPPAPPKRERPKSALGGLLGLLAPVRRKKSLKL